MSTLTTIPLTTIDGAPATLADYSGKVLLIVNVASKCGLTPQYTALEALYQQYKDRGLVVLGFPANDFGAQEPGTNDEIATFCRSSFGVNFPLFSKIVVTGAETHPLYKSLIAAAPTAIGNTRTAFREKLAGFLGKSGATPNPEPGILWNFEKFLVARDGTVVARFSPEVAPDDPTVLVAIESALVVSAPQMVIYSGWTEPA